MSVVILIAGSVMILIAVVLLASMFIAANRVKLTEKTDGKPEWMHAMPPKETVEATMKDGEGVTLYDYDEGEKLAAPFAEQIEDVLRAKVESDPYLKSFDIDFGTAEDGGLDIWVNGEKYNGVNQLPDENLKQAFLQAVKDWNSRK
ncbi:MAG: hypothetical protein H6634_05560 [Anaerolineales bacterium]|nr:hypothetical protein [Anaerolineales bacterium]